MKLILANFKMNLLKNDIINYLNVINNKMDKGKVIFFPNNLYIEYFKDRNYLVGSQDISFKEFGSLTGDTSVIQLKELGINYTLIGHSERREYFLDNNYISKKVNLALSNNVKVVLCVGEKKEDYLNKKKSLEIVNQNKRIQNRLGINSIVGKFSGEKRLNNLVYM